MATLAERAMSGTPIIEGNSATFVWQGLQAPQLIGDLTDWEHGPPISLARVAPQLWAHTVTLPAGAYLEYAYWDGNQRLADPLNPRTSPDGFGHRNHFVYMPGAAPTPLTRRRRSVAHGTLSRHVVAGQGLIAGERRTVYLYRPVADQPCPLLIVLDGQDYRHRAGLPNIVDNLVAAGRIRPLALAMVDNSGRGRFLEYSCNEATLAFLVSQVLPLAQQELPLLDLEANPGAYGILGASLGGLQALYSAMRLPHILGNVLSQSGAFTLDGYDTVVWDLVRHDPLRPIRVWMDAGLFERLLECNRRMCALLAERGYAATYREYGGGHNFPSWRDDLERGLELLFGAP